MRPLLLEMTIADVENTKNVFFVYFVKSVTHDFNANSFIFLIFAI